MENLSRIAQGIFLGNGEVWNFLDYAVNRNCGGLLYKTQQLDLLDTNFTNNFNDGHKRRYEYSEIPTFNAYSINPLTGKIFSTDLARNIVNSQYPIHGRGGNLGDLYTVPEFSSNSALKLITKENFKALGEEIRKKSLSNNVLRQPYKDTVAESYAGQINEKWKDVGLKEVGLGDEIKLWDKDDVKRPKYSLEEFASSAWLKQELINIDIQDKKGVFIHNEDTYRYFSVDHPIHYHNITAKVSERTFERLKRIDEVANGERLKYKSPLEGIRNPWGRKSWWNNEDSYGVETNNRGQEYYSIKDKNIFNGEVPISSKFNSGEQTTFNRDSGVRVYSYFQEYENGSARTSVNHMGEISDGSSVLIDSYSGSSASRLLKKTNQLFRDAKINSLINRFHTDAKDIDSELITAADSNFGLSRGRNLLKKKYEGEQVGDTTTGYDNPYCRVWTAHHQYSKLKHRIRPFVGDDGKPLSLSETQSNYGLMRPEEGLTRLNDYSVLGADGFVKITPTHDNG